MKEQLERDIIRYVITIGMLYSAYVTFTSLFPVFFPANAAIATTLSIVFTLLLVQNQREKNIEWISFTLHLVVLTAMTFFWIKFGGLAGSVPAILLGYVGFVVMASSGWARQLTLLLILLQQILLFTWPEWVGMNSFSQPDKTGREQLLLDYWVAGAMLFAFVYYFKYKFSFYRKKAAFAQRELNQSVGRLHEQNKELALREEEVRAINDNLETLVDERAHQMEAKNLELAEYAFINAHMLRGPLCRIMGLLNLMEKDAHLYSPEDLQKARAAANAIDQHIREINHVVS